MHNNAEIILRFLRVLNKTSWHVCYKRNENPIAFVIKGCRELSSLDEDDYNCLWFGENIWVNSKIDFIIAIKVCYTYYSIWFRKDLLLKIVHITQDDHTSKLLSIWGKNQTTVSLHVRKIAFALEAWKKILNRYYFL